MKQKEIITYNLGFVLSNIYLEVIILCLEPNILNEKVEVLFVLLVLQLFYHIVSMVYRNENIRLVQKKIRFFSVLFI